MPQVLFETVWDTKQFNNKADWPTDGTQPFVWSFGDATGYANHADYVFGWKGAALQNLMDQACVVNCPGANPKTQSTAAMNKCTQTPIVKEDINGCKCSFYFGLAAYGPIFTLWGYLLTLHLRFHRVFYSSWRLQGRVCLIQVFRAKEGWNRYWKPEYLEKPRERVRRYVPEREVEVEGSRESVPHFWINTHFVLY
jgi:hypothetical protein